MWCLQLLEKRIRWVEAAAGEEMLGSRIAQAGWQKGFIPDEALPQMFVQAALPQDAPPADNYFDLLTKSPFRFPPLLAKLFLAAPTPPRPALL